MNFKEFNGDSSQAIKDVDEKSGVVVGYFSAFGNIDSDGDIINKGAFKKTIQESGLTTGKSCRIKHLLNHDKERTVAVIKSLEEDDFGLKYESKAGSHTLGQDWLKMCTDGIITEHSIGFDIIKSNKSSASGTNVNYLTELRLWEGSSLTHWGANSNTPIVGVKELKDLLPLFDNLQKALSNGTYTDETFIMLEEKYKELGEIFKSLQKPSIDDTPSEITTEPEPIVEETKSVDYYLEKFKKGLNGRGE